MATSPDRRRFLQTSAALGTGSLTFLQSLPPVRAEEAKPDPALVRLDSGIEPLVLLLETTPRDKLLEEVGLRIKKGLAYRDILTALLLAGVRNIQPRPSVGFKFHAVLVVNSAHQAALAALDQERWLPLFWALDSFKSGQAANLKESGWRMKPTEEAKVPSAKNAAKAFVASMEAWDVEAADFAAAGLRRQVVNSPRAGLAELRGERESFVRSRGPTLEPRGGLGETARLHIQIAAVERQPRHPFHVRRVRRVFLHQLFKYARCVVERSDGFRFATAGDQPLARVLQGPGEPKAVFGSTRKISGQSAIHIRRLFAGYDGLHALTGFQAGGGQRQRTLRNGVPPRNIPRMPGGYLFADGEGPRQGRDGFRVSIAVGQVRTQIVEPRGHLFGHAQVVRIVAVNRLEDGDCFRFDSQGLVRVPAVQADCRQIVQPDGELAAKAEVVRTAGEGDAKSSHSVLAGSLGPVEQTALAEPDPA
ncbi:hypothetical protein BH11PLA2_BH11PLA2_41630 [soil metagenome]